MKACPHCQNTIGFVFGTCCQCGWNYLEHRFHFVTVWHPEANGIDPELIAIHAMRTRREPIAPALADVTSTPDMNSEKARG